MEFEVRCDSCRVIYGRGGSPRRLDAGFRWHATISAPVGERVILRVRRLGDRLQSLLGIIRVDGSVVARQEITPASGPDEIQLSHMIQRRAGRQ